MSSSYRNCAAMGSAKIDADDLFHVSVAQLLAGPGERKEVSGRGKVGPVATTVAEVEDEAAQVKLTLEALASGEIAVYGEVSAEWQGECRRCLEQVRGKAVVKIKEIFEASHTEGETYQLDESSVHLREMTREALLLHLPLAPLCSSTCAGPKSSSVKLAEQPKQPLQRIAQPDPRWAALEDLKFED